MRWPRSAFIHIAGSTKNDLPTGNAATPHRGNRESADSRGTRPHSALSHRCPVTRWCSSVTLTEQSKCRDSAYDGGSEGQEWPPGRGARCRRRPGSDPGDDAGDGEQQHLPPRIHSETDSARQAAENRVTTDPRPPEMLLYQDLIPASASQVEDVCMAPDNLTSKHSKPPELSAPAIQATRHRDT